ncbi:MAG: prepilin-type N-terminal cleavage/methylation domain-containing protein [Proteobacteria bacterium]|nr:prepilin-type N-terminal cleavage/methylation domain-containing protein [Pseudomonadota bacterium]
MKKSSRSAFTLVELSVSLIIASIILGMVTQGIKIVASSRLNAARSITSRSPVKSISGLVAWYETTSTDSLKKSETDDQKQISDWYDISPDSIPAKKNSLIRIAPSAAVTYESDGINKLPSIKFNGTNRIELANFYQGSSSQNTIFIVAKPSNINTTILDSSSAASATTSISQNSNSIRLDLGSSVPTGTATDPVKNLINVSYIAVIYFNGSSSKAYFNNALAMAGGSTINPGNSSLNGLSVGATRNNTTNYSGLISEIIIYNRPLQIQERKDVMSYLSKKYGISVVGI